MNDEQKFLAEYDFDKYDKPSVAADMAVFTIMQESVTDNEYRKLPDKKLKLLLIKRGDWPYKDMWALPGGFLKKGETIYDTARRELKEETGTDKAYLEMCYTFSEQDRDPRGWIISQSFMALVNGEVESESEEGTTGVHAGSDAKEAEWFEVILKKKDGIRKDMICDNTYELILISPKKNGESTILSAIVREHKIYRDYHELVEYSIVQSEGIAFDHAKIITCILNKLRRDVEIDARIVFDLMPEYFTLTDIQKAVEIILDRELIKPNFRRKIDPYVVKTQEKIMDGAHRPSYLFKRNIEAFYR